MLLRILLVNAPDDDCEIIRNSLNENISVTSCRGFEALGKIDRNEDIDLVILDLSVYDDEGFELLSALKSNTQHSNLRTIILIKAGEFEKEIKGFELGAIDSINKPLRNESFKAVISLHKELLEQQIYKRKSHERDSIFEAIFQQAPIGIAISYSIDPSMEDKDELFRINPVYEQITGRKQEELLKLGWMEITHPDDLAEELRHYKKLQAGEIKSYSMEKRFIRPDGSLVWVHIVAAALFMSAEQGYDYICLVQDISQSKAIKTALTESERSKSVLLSHLTGMAYRCDYDRDWTMRFVSAGCFKLTGYTPESLINNRDLPYNDLIAPEYRGDVWYEWGHVLSRKLPYKGEYEIITADRERKWVLEMGEGIFDKNGEVEALEGIIFDISDIKKVEEELRYNSEHDSWTGLHNRRYLVNRLHHDIKQKYSGKSALVCVNLGGMYLISMTYGFQYYRELIKKTAEALNSHCNEDCSLFHTSENRFIFYVENYKYKDELTGFCEAVSATLESLLAVERISGGIGVVEINERNEHDPELILKDLLITSEKAIETFDRDFGHCFFDTDMEEHIVREEGIKQELAQVASDEAVEQLFMHYQPILDLKTSELYAFEALARFNSVRYGPVLPMEFIPLAEKTKLIIPLGEKIIDQVFRFLNKLKENGYGSIGISINISPVQLLRKDFVENLSGKIKDMQIDPRNVGIEITESVFASNYQEINNILARLKDMGIRIAIDDFGTGYSSLARGRELNINYLKIDKYFIDKLLILKDIEESITGDIISMTHKMGHLAIAEGVEYEKQRDYLKKYGCDSIQGYLISRPLDEEAAIEFLKKQTSIKSSVP